jgi:MFS family permease
VDRVGPRRIGLVGICFYTLAFSSLGLANGTAWQWWLLGGVQAIGVAFITNPVWLSAVIPCFHASRGLALAVSLAGIGVATLIWPNIAAFGIAHLGWRLTFAAMAIFWAVIVLPYAWFCLIDPPSTEPSTAAATKAPKSDYLHALRSPTAIHLALAGGIFASVTYGIILNLVPMLQAQGMTLTAAAGLTSIMGLFVIGGRLTTGYLLDRFPTRPLSVVVFLLPVIVCLILWLFPGNRAAILIAVALLGLATGSETDVVVYLIAQRFARDIFATVLAVVGSAFALLAATGPLLAGGIFDNYKSYDPYLLISIPLALLATLCIALVPDKPVEVAAEL